MNNYVEDKRRINKNMIEQKYIRNTKFNWIEYNIIEEKEGWIYYKANTSDFISVSRKLTNI